MKILTLKSPLLEKLRLLDKPLGDLHAVGTDKDLFTFPRVAIVGSRKPTPYGLQVTEKLSSDLARAGVVIVSGLAFGVDITAHKAALQAGGRTIAVLPSGLEAVYPASHGRIAIDIQREGLLVSEYEPTHKPMQHDFLDRNRLIASFSDFVIVTEAAAKSGSLNTAAHALRMGIPVGAVPGPITNSLSSGTNRLIQQGARLITSAQDVLDMLNIKESSEQMSLLGANEIESAVLQALHEQSTDITGLAANTDIDTKVLLSTLTMLEIHGRVQQDTIGNWHLL